MRKLVILCSLVFFMACNQASDYTISGTLNNSTDGQKVYVSQLDPTTNQPVPVDTTEVTEGKFLLDLEEVETPTLSFLTFEGVRGNVIFVADNTPITFEVYPDSIFATKIEGGDDNRILTEYTSKMKASQKEMGTIRSAMMEAFSRQDSVQLMKYQNEQDAVIKRVQTEQKQVVANNPNSVISLLVLQELVNGKVFPAKELQALYDDFSPELKETTMGKSIAENLANLSLVEIGSEAPNFTAPNPEGENIALKDVLGKVTLIDFWASWCKPCRQENPNIVRVYEKYHDKGFNALGVSLDKEGHKDRWIQAIADDNLSWPQVSNLKFWQDPIAVKYGIRAIPAAFLLDENGIIVAKNLRGAALENKVAELLGEE